MSSEAEFLIYFCICMVLVTFWHWIEKISFPNNNIQHVGPPAAAPPRAADPQPSPAAGYHHDVFSILYAGRQNGLDRDVLKSMPIFTYATSASAGPQECSVCLSVFQDRDSYRILPTCKHMFHAECIDMWLYSHSNCPLCRAIVGPTPPLVVPVAGPS